MTPIRFFAYLFYTLIGATILGVAVCACCIILKGAFDVRAPLWVIKVGAFMVATGFVGSSAYYPFAEPFREACDKEGI